MDRFLTVVGSLVAASVIGYGVVRADDRVAPMAPASPRPAAAPAGPASDLLDMATLSVYDYQPGMKNLPESIQALDGKTVKMRGFLLPLFEFEDVHVFSLVANHMSCCFGMPAGITGQVYVEVKASEPGLPNTNEPIEVVGTFHAHERTEQGYVLAVFEIVDAKARVVGY